MTVTFEDVGYEVGGRRILKGLNLHVETGETLVLLGRSGSGKTTALRLVNGLLTPTSGRVLVDGKPVSEWDVIALRRRTGYVIQETGLFPHFTVARNVGLVPRLLEWPEERIAARVAEFDLPFGDRLPHQLSGGQRQRVGIARAMAAHPGLLLMDEPFGALDPVNRHDLQQQFLALRGKENVTSVFVTHDVREALIVASRIALLRDGALELVTTPADFRRSTNEEARRFQEVLN